MNDDLNAARGILTGCALGAVFWVVLWVFA
jgi:hypothetical protein